MKFFKRSRRDNRRIDLQRFAHAVDGVYMDQGEINQLYLLKDFNLFKTGTNHRFYNFIKIIDGEKEINIFDYVYNLKSNGSGVVSQTVFFLNSKKIGLPQFFMKPEHLFHSIGSYLGIEDIDFEEYPKFSDQYFLKGEDESFIRSTFNDEILKFFSIEKGWYLEGMNYYMIFYKKRKVLTAKKIAEMYRRGQFLYANLRDEGLTKL